MGPTGGDACNVGGYHVRYSNSTLSAIGLMSFVPVMCLAEHIREGHACANVHVLNRLVKAIAVGTTVLTTMWKYNGFPIFAVNGSMWLNLQWR